MTESRDHLGRESRIRDFFGDGPDVSPGEISEFPQGIQSAFSGRIVFFDDRRVESFANARHYMFVFETEFAVIFVCGAKIFSGRTIRPPKNMILHHVVGKTGKNPGDLGGHCSQIL